ncbi:uncharacterized protein LOC132266460 [Cornus florida]|uniref:uncharacterized protein LOC132266460 n=1 Tax=Cornus florida TaxID=4283 RepID=UPI00289B356F|nr:uncharacterized protein LOC132266460 [Cornus florida]
MASSSSNTWIFSLKVVLISAGIVSIAMATKFSAPLIINFAVYEVPLIWSTLLSWLKPPYLYLIINGIIITIAASSRLYQKLDHRTHSEPPLVSPKPLSSDLRSDFAAVSTQSEFRVLKSTVVYEDEARVPEVNRELLNGLEVGDQDEDKFVISTQYMESPAMYEDEANFPEVNDHEVRNGSEVDDIQDEDEFVISTSSWTPLQRMSSLEMQTEYILPATEKPPISSRFGHRKPVKASPEGGKALKVAKPKRHETLENTWKMITDGRHMPLTRHLKRSEAWENRDRQFNAGPHDSSPDKSETSNVDHANSDPPSSSGKLRKEPSLSQEELNRRVEAFINKFNDDIRLQRQESLKRYREMINRGAH